MQTLHAMPTQTSLKKRLLIFVSGFSLLLGGVLIATAYWISLGELDEILDVSDRIAVIHDGSIHGIVLPAETTKQELGKLMAGGHLK